MEKHELLAAGKTYKIVQVGNSDVPLVYEPANVFHFRRLMTRHLWEICKVLSYEIRSERIELILRFYDETDLPEKYRHNLHLPISNLLNAYAKAINKRYDRKGSLFKRRFERELIEN